MMSNNNLIDWHISSSSLVLGCICDFIYILVGCFVFNDWDVSVIRLNLGLVFCFPNCIVSSLTLCFVLNLMLNSVRLLEYSFVSNLFLLIVQDLVLIGVPDLFLVFVEGFSVVSVQDLDVCPVSVLFLLFVLDFPSGFPDNDWYIPVVGLSVGIVYGSWHIFIFCQVLFFVLDLIFGGVPLFCLLFVLDFYLSVNAWDGDIPGSPLYLFLFLDVVLNLFVVYWEFLYLGLLSVFDVSMFILVIVACMVVV